jgi:hypothetical protein
MAEMGRSVIAGVAKGGGGASDPEMGGRKTMAIKTSWMQKFDDNTKNVLCPNNLRNRESRAITIEAMWPEYQGESFEPHG